MEEKANHIITIGFIAIIVLFFAVIDPFLVFAGKGDFSDIEDSVLVGKEKLANIHDELERLAGKKEYNGVYLGEDGYLIERVSPKRFSDEECQEKIELLQNITGQFNTSVMLVPSKACVLQDKMPAMTDSFDEVSFLKKVKQAVGGNAYVDVYDTLVRHHDEEIYYRTDSHWTTLGAYYGYVKWRTQTQYLQYFYDPKDLVCVKEFYYGPLSTKVPFATTADRIMVFPKTLEKEVSVTYDFWNMREGFYDEAYLESDNSYGYFLGDHHGFAEIKTGNVRRKSLFVLRDATADSMIPLLAPYYDKIYILDVKFYKGDLIRFMNEYLDEQDEVLILYDVLTFLEEFDYD